LGETPGNFHEVVASQKKTRYPSGPSGEKADPQSGGVQPVRDDDEILQVGRGMPTLNSTGRGDLVVRIRVIIPPEKVIRSSNPGPDERKKSASIGSLR